VTPAARAEFQISVYGGANTASDSDVIFADPTLAGTFEVDWEGDSFRRPPYYGVRGTYWLNDPSMAGWGVAVDFTHAKVKADLADPALLPFSTLEFTNGINSLTLNGLYRMPLADRFSIYAGAGAGASIPHVEVRVPPGPRTFEYQVTGPVVQGLAGASVDIWRGLSAFGEYKASYSWNSAELVGGGSLETDILVHHFAVGLSLSFGGPAF
jgi:lipid A oxidase